MMFDHHCPYTGNCIGARNYTYFFSLVLLSLLLSLYFIVAGAITLEMHYQELVSNGSTGILKIVTTLCNDKIVVVLMELLSLIMCCNLFILFFFHLRIIAYGMTTSEYLRKVFDSGKSPYDKGFCGNFKERMFKGAPSSLVANGEVINVGG
jgi:palmitoyltransferase ZDHHC9/14/18